MRQAPRCRRSTQGPSIASFCSPLVPNAEKSKQGPPQVFQNRQRISDTSHCPKAGKYSELSCRAGAMKAEDKLRPERPSHRRSSQTACGIGAVLSVNRLFLLQIKVNDVILFVKRVMKFLLILEALFPRPNRPNGVD